MGETNYFIAQWGEVSDRRDILFYKPYGVLSQFTDNDAAEVQRQTLKNYITVPGVYPVGRLDWDSEGLILMTNDGELTNRLTHPRYGHQKEYRVLVAKRPEPEQLATWRRGVVLEDGYKTAPANVYAETGAGKGCWLRLSMGEGRKRQIREIGSLLGLPVVRIVRVGIGSLQVGSLKPGEWRHLTISEVAELKGKKHALISPQRKTSGKSGIPGRSRSKYSQERKRK